MPNKKPKAIDPLAFMERSFNSVPPSALAAFENANKQRHSRKEPKLFKPAILNHQLPSLKTPAVVAADDSALAPVIAAHVRHGLRNFRSGREAQNALMTLRDAMARLHGDDDNAAARYLRARGLKPLAIATGGTPQGGGYLTPDAVTGAIQLRLMEVGAARALATVVPVAAGQSSVPVQLTQPTVHYVNETSSITESTPTLGSLGISVDKRAVLVKVTNELMSDSAFSVVDAFVGMTSNALAAVEDGEAILGDGTSAYGGERGLLTELGAGGVYAPANGTGKSTWSGLTVTDVAAMVAKLPAQYCHPDNRFVCSTPFLAILATMSPPAVTYTADGKPMFWGRRVQLTEKMPRTTAVSQVSLLFGDFPNALTFADRGITFATSNLAPGAFAEDLTILRAVSRYDIVCHNGGDASNAGAYVGLKTAAS